MMHCFRKKCLWKVHSLFRHGKIVYASNMLNLSEYPLLVSNLSEKMSYLLWKKVVSYAYKYGAY